MANPKAVKVEISEADFNRAATFGLNVYVGGDAPRVLLPTWREVNQNQCAFADGVATIPIPEDFFEVAGQPDMPVSVAVREDRSGGAGGYKPSDVFNVVWEVPASSLGAVTLVF